MQNAYAGCEMKMFFNGGIIIKYEYVKTNSMKTKKRKYQSPNIQVVQLDVFISLYMNSLPPTKESGEEHAFNALPPISKNPLLT